MNQAIEDTDWASMDLDLVIECTGKFRTVEQVSAYLERGVKQVVVAAPMKRGLKILSWGLMTIFLKPAKTRLLPLPLAPPIALPQ